MNPKRLSLPFSEENVAVLKEKLPYIQGRGLATVHDTISTQLWGVLHPSYTEEELHNHLGVFFTDTEKIPKKIHSYIWEKRIVGMISGGYKGGAGAEYFFLDYLMRNSHRNENYTCAHRKGRHVLDNHIKADMVTTVHHHNHIHSSHIIGTQIQYCSLEESYPNTTKHIPKKEIDILEGITLKQQIINALPVHLRPEIPCLVRLSSNSLLGSEPDHNKGNIFAEAVLARGAAGYHGGGPTLHLPEEYLKDLVNMSYFYQKSCRTFTRFLHTLQEEKQGEKELYSTTEHESAYRVNTYDPALGRATYEFYEKTELQKLFLTIIFRVPKKTTH